MSNPLKHLLLALIGLFGLPLLVFGITLIATAGTYQVPATVSQNPALPRVRLNQTDFHVQTFGNPANPPLLALHDGPGGDASNLSALKALASNHHVILFDQRGSGLSARVPAEQLTMEAQIKDVEAFADRYAPNRPLRLLGHGWGGMLATAYAGRHPGRVERLILAEPGFLNTEMAGQVMPVMNQTSAGFLLTAGVNWIRSQHVPASDAEARSDFVFARLRHHPAYYCGQQIPDQAADLTRRAGFLAWKMVTHSTFNDKGQLELDFTKGIDRYQRPVLLLAGECNTLTGKAFQTRQTKLFKQAGLVNVPRSGHELFVDNPEASLKAVSDFLASGRLPAEAGS